MIISVFVINFPPSSSPQVFLFVCLFCPKGIFVARHLRHFFVTGFVKITLTTVFNITFTVLTFRLTVKKVLLKVLPQVRGGNDDRNGIYSSPTEAMSDDDILFVYPLRGALAKKCACVSFEMA